MFKRSAVSLAMFLCTCSGLFGAGLTIVTHGFNSSARTWVDGMCRAIPRYAGLSGTNVSYYEIYFTNNGVSYVPSWRRVGDTDPFSNDSGEVIVRLDWSEISSSSISTYDVGWVIGTVLTWTNFIGDLRGHAPIELPVHLVGHSRGGSLISQIARVLGTNGVWVDQMTFIDPLPFTGDGPAVVPVNVLYADNYWQHLTFTFQGDPVAGAYNRELTYLEGGYFGLYSQHFDTHLWYHGTIDLGNPASDGSAAIDIFEREHWWQGDESQGANTGFRFSRIGKGDRRSDVRPAGPDTSRVRDGFNRRYDLGLSVTNNRVSLPFTSGLVPNIITASVVGTNRGTCGSTFTAGFHYQWAQASVRTARVEVVLDRDRNPWNTNEVIAASLLVVGTGGATVGYREIPFRTGSAFEGTTHVFLRISSGNSRRVMYLDRELMLVPCSPPALSVTRISGGTVEVRTVGPVGSEAVLLRSHDLSLWYPVATNVLTAFPWVVSDVIILSNRFYRVFVR